jgi:hypothetical protein
MKEIIETTQESEDDDGDLPDDADGKNMYQIISDKSSIHLHGNVIELVILCFLKKAVDRN